MNNKIKYSLLATLLSISAMADSVKVSDVESEYSAKSAVKANKSLEQNINLGFSSTTGNTETVNLNAKYEASLTTVGYNNKALKVAFGADAFLTKNDGIENNKEFTANLGLEQYIDSSWLAYASMDWLKNEYTGYDSKISLGAGLGKELFNDSKQSLKVKFGVAYNIENFSIPQEDEKFSSLTQYLEYNNKLNSVSTLYAKLGASENLDDMGDDYEILFVAGLTFAVADNINISIDQEVRYDKLPPVGGEKTDTKSIVRVGYRF